MAGTMVQSEVKDEVAMDREASESSVMSSDPTACHLCTEMQTGQFPKEYRDAYGVPSRICYAAADLIVVPSVSPVSSGHVLIMPRRHLTRLADLPEASLQQLLDCVHFVEKRLRACFGPSLYLVEHGVKRGQMACGIDHAHLHLMCLPSRIIETVEQDLVNQFPSGAEGPLYEVLKVGASHQNECYLVHGSSSTSLRIAFAEKIPSQYVRRAIAKASSHAKWDWKLLYGRAEFVATRNAFFRI